MRFEIKALQRKFGITVMYVTHDQEVALAISDRIAIMDNEGRIRQIGTPYEIFEQPADLFIFKFMGIANFLAAREENGKYVVGSGHQVFPWEGPKGTAKMYRKAPEPATDVFRIYNIELPKFRATNPTLESVREDPLLRWLYLLDEGYKSDHEMEVLSGMTEGMKAFAKRYKVSLDDPNLRRMYDYEMSARRDQASREYNAEMKGRAAGRVEERAQIIRGMLKKGIPAEIICECTGASKAEVDAILAKMRTEA